MGNRPGESHFRSQELKSLRLVRDGSGQDLQSDSLVQRCVLGQVHLPHGSATEQALNPVAFQENVTGRKPVGRGSRPTRHDETLFGLATCMGGSSPKEERTALAVDVGAK
jgi:hypothetical protein